MKPKSNPIQQWTLILGACSAWLAFFLQFYILLSKYQLPFGLLLLRFFSYFTIIGTLIAALYFSRELSFFIKKGNTIKLAFFPPIMVVSYATFVTLGYHVLLQNVWNPQGLQWYVDKLLHVLVPLLVIFYWAFFADKKTFTWSIIPKTLILPILFFVYVMIIGRFTDNYPYPFFDVDKNGFGHVFLFGIGLLVTLSIIVGLYGLISKRIVKYSHKAKGV